MSQGKSVALSTHPRFSLLVPRTTLPRTGESFQVVSPPPSRAEQLLRSAFSSRLIAIDFETRGNDYSLSQEEAAVVGIGLSWNEGSMYLDVNSPEYGDSIWDCLTRLLLTHPGLLAHNIYFDGGWIRRDLDQHSQWYACTYGLYMQLAGEGWTGQRWGLKDAMTEVLQWADTNEHDLDQWLIDNGYHKQNGKPEKGEMWRAPAPILGKYCVMDAEATYLLMTQHFEPILEKFPEVLRYHQEDFLPHVLLHIDQKRHGIAVDREHWLQYRTELEATIAQCTIDFLSHDLVSPHVSEYESAKLQEHLAKEPPRHKKVKERKEPARLTKSGKVSKNWEKWLALSTLQPVESLNWQGWNTKRERILAREESDYLFNIQSGDQLRWLFYEKLGYSVLDTTETGLPAVGEDALKSMGELGQLLIRRIGAAKELSYLDDYLSRTEMRNTIHPSFKLPGTVTGRLSGKSPNLQQIPKTRGTLAGFVSRPGHSFVDCDVNALEMVVTTELSQDKNLLALYGPGAKKNDIYLFYASMMPILGPKILATGYDPYNPTSEAMTWAKKECKTERSIAKLLILSDNYGSGIGKKQKILRLNGVDMSYSEVSEMHEALLAAKEGVMRYVARLEDEWRYNKGWVYNGYGLPIAVHESKKKDLLNRVVQGTGHQILQLYVRITTQLLTDARLDWQPIVMDWHDESIIEVPDEQVPEARRILEHEAYRILNETLGGTCPLKGSAAVSKTLAGIKIEE